MRAWARKHGMPPASRTRWSACRSVSKANATCSTTWRRPWHAPARGIDRMTAAAAEPGARDIRRILADAILRTSAEAIIATDRAGRVCFWTPGAPRIFGFEAGEAIGPSLDLITPEAPRARHWQGYRQAMAAGRSRYGEGD